VIALLLAATAAAHGPVTFELRTYAASVEVVQGPAESVTVSTPGSNSRIDIEENAGRFEARVDGRRQVREGKVRLELPAGSNVEITTVTGSIEVSGALRELRARTMSGSVVAAGASKADVETIDGSVRIAGAEENVRVHTIAGPVKIDAAGPAIQAEVETSSGSVDVRGQCGKGCRIDVDSVSGEVRFALDPKSSFGLRFTSHSGKLRDRGASTGGGDAWTDTSWGAGEGRIECETFSADTILTAR
jgi:DUF4097 and DUF4098 domain-containing protein YvlB